VANKDIRTNVVVSAETKGFDQAKQKAAKFNADAAKSAETQAKGFAEAQKSSIAFDKSLDRLNKTLKGSTGDFKKHMQTVKKEFDALDKMNFKDVQKQIGNVQDHLTELHKEQAAVTSVMREMGDKSGPAYDKLKDYLKTVTAESKTAQRQVENLTKAFREQSKEADRAAREAEQRRGAFAQGLAQGGLPFPAPFLQRGPGMGRQAAGMAVGMGVMGAGRAARGVGAAAFGGVQGMAQGISSIPIVGGALAGQFTAAAGYAQQNIAWQRAKLAQAPYTEGIGEIMGRRRYLASRSKRYGAAMEAKSTADVRLEDISQQAEILRQGIRSQQQADRDRRTLAAAKGEGVLAYGKELVGQKATGVQRSIGNAVDAIGAGITNMFSGIGTGKFDPVGAVVKQAESGLQKGRLLADPEGGMLSTENMIKKLRVVEGQIKKQRETVKTADVEFQKVQKSASKQYGAGPFRDIGRLGVSLLGVSKPEAAQMMGDIVRAGGGRKGEAQEQGMIGAGFAARTLFGVGAETSGAFLGAGRRGGLVGARGQAGNAFKTALAEGLQMGLEGSELNKWMQQTAQGIQQFSITGIPINTQSISTLASDISAAGITGTRAATMARGLTTGLQGIGQRGIQSGLDHLMLQLVGGYQGGGAAEYRAARSRMEELGGTVRGKGVGGIAGDSVITDAFRKLMEFSGGGPAAQTEILQRSMEKLGVRGSIKEFDWFGRKIRGEEATPEQLQAIQAEQQRRAGGRGEIEAIRQAGGLEGAARLTVGAYAPAARAQASLANQQIAVGGKMVKTVMRLERASLRTTAAFTTLAGPTLDNVTKSLDALAQQAVTTAEAVAAGDFSGFYN
jgi:hypothetical protein